MKHKTEKLGLDIKYIGPIVLIKNGSFLTTA